jgi:hypothetical protein
MALSGSDGLPKETKLARCVHEIVKHESGAHGLATRSATGWQSWSACWSFPTITATSTARWRTCPAERSRGVGYRPRPWPT